jgi:5-methylcytosine rRNA methyltransferase NSUN4
VFKDYYCLDGSSLLPVIALDIQKDDNVLDLCASPGGKTLSILQTLLPKSVTACDITQNRLDRLKRMLQTYIDKSDFDRIVNIENNKVDIDLWQSNTSQFNKVKL